MKRAAIVLAVLGWIGLGVVLVQWARTQAAYQRVLNEEGGE